MSGRQAAEAPVPLGLFLRALSARHVSPHTLRSYESGVSGYLEWLAGRGISWQ